MIDDKKRNNHIFLLITFIFINLLICYTIFCFVNDMFSFKITNYRVSYNELVATIKSDTGFRNNSGKLSMKSQEIIDSLKGITIVQISDFHNEQFGENNKDIVLALKQINPDIVLITGDLVSRKNKDYNGAYSLLENIGEKYKCYYITGNHEKALSKEAREQIISKVKECGIEYIDDKMVEILPYVHLYGLNYNNSFYGKKSYKVENMQEAIGEPVDNYFNILATHDPDSFNVYNDWGADLIFAGHTHGGMVRIFDKGLVSPDRTFWPKYDGGIFNDNDGNEDFNAMIVSKGLSEGQNGFRLFNTPELVVIKF